jgi:hypothetical protein
MVFAQFLQMAKIGLTHSVTFPKGRSLELAGADLGDVMSQLAPYRIL